MRAHSRLLIPDMYFPKGATAFLKTANTFLEKLFSPAPFPPLLPPPPAPSPLLPRGPLAHLLLPAGLPVDGGYDYIWGPEQPRRRPGEASRLPNLHSGERAPGPRGVRAGAEALSSALCPPPSATPPPRVHAPPLGSPVEPS